ncbi:MAG: hypothetical protein ACI8PZ_003273 [Myxococcota bacterium]|jgi:hypothetical protein
MLRVLPLLLLAACSEFDLRTTGDVEGIPHIDPVDPVAERLTGAPELVIHPASHDFGAGQLGCPEAVTLTLENVGDAPLRIDALSYDGAQMELESPAVPAVLAGGESILAWVTYRPVAAGSGWGELAVTSNDPRGEVVADQRGDTLPGTTLVDVFDVVDPPVDLLFAVDQSRSMGDDQAILAEAFDGFIAGLSEITGDWQLGVVTLDDGCVNHGVLRPDTPGLAELFADAVTVDAGGTSLTEALLALASQAVDVSEPGGCNEGLLRPDATLHVVVVSDEHEQSGEPVAFVDAILAAHGDDTTVSAVVDVDHRCGDPLEGGPYGYDDAAHRTGGLLLDICDDGWGDRAADLAAATAPPAQAFPLSERPVPSSVEVFVDGSPRTRGWSWNAVDNAVVVAPLGGASTVEVAYRPDVACTED